jgi:hypothetical protein
MVSSENGPKIEADLNASDFFRNIHNVWYSNHDMKCSI